MGQARLHRCQRRHQRQHVEPVDPLPDHRLAAAAAGRPVLVDVQQPIGNDYVSVYPNPVTGNQFTVDFKRNKPGIYNIALTDLAGRVLLNKVANIQAEGQAERVSLKNKPAQGMYLIRVTNSDKEIVFSDKIFIN